MMTARRIAITGATGFVGRRLIRAALSRGHSVVALAREPGQIDPGQGDGMLAVEPWSTGEPLPAISADCLVHLAAHIPANMADPAETATCFAINTVANESLAADCARLGIGRIVGLSSGNIYAPGLDRAYETSPTYPSGHGAVYLASKLAGELVLQAGARAHGIPSAIVRPGSIYGPGQKPKGLLNTLLADLGKGAPVTLRDGGAFRADFVHVDDVVGVIIAVLETGSDGIFNAGSGEALSALEVGRIVARYFGRSEDLVSATGPAGAFGFAALDMTRSMEVLGVRPRPFAEGLSDWLSENGTGETARP